MSKYVVSITKTCEIEVDAEDRAMAEQIARDQEADGSVTFDMQFDVRPVTLGERTINQWLRVLDDEHGVSVYESGDCPGSFGFTGCDLHASWAVPEQRRLLVNALLWCSKLPVPATGAATDSPVDLAKNLDRKIFTPKAKKPAPAAKQAAK